MDKQVETITVVRLPDRGVLAIEGPDRTPFLQGLVSNDVAAVSPKQAVWAAFLTPQGKYLHDFIMLADGDRLLLDLAAADLADLMTRLKKFKLRTKVTLADCSEELIVAAVLGPQAHARFGLPDRPGAATGVADGTAVVDPRHQGLGVRLVLRRSEAEAVLASFGPAGTFGYYEGLRLDLGIPDGAKDMIPEKSILLENGFDELNGVSWTKGCYMGQELTARTKYRGLVKKRLLPVTVEGELPAPGTVLTLGGKEAGEMRSGLGDRGLALIRLDAMTEIEQTGAALQAGDTVIRPHRPDWLRLPGEAA